MTRHIWNSRSGMVRRWRLLTVSWRTRRGARVSRCSGRGPNKRRANVNSFRRAGFVCGALWAGVLSAAPSLPVDKQNTLIQTYCAVCHTDAAMNGLLSLQHFDARHADPQVAAFLLSKLTNGLTPAQVL